MKEILAYLFSHKTLPRAEAHAVLVGMAQGNSTEAQMAAFMAVFLMRLITVEELMGFRDALLELCQRIDLDAYDTMDVCGTGGDGKDTFNISTLAAFVVAGAGQAVAKHGNYGVSSVSGSSTVMEYLGYRFTNNLDTIKAGLDKANICFLHAPLFNPAMKTVAPVRKALGMKTFFNQLGPMVNPAAPKKQLIGVFSLELLRLYGYLHQGETKQYALLHDLGGYDEFSLTGPTKMISAAGEQILTPASLGLPTYSQADLETAGTIEDAARIFTNVLDGKGTQAQQDVVCANAALALKTARSISFEDAWQSAKESLTSGRAKASFTNLLATSTT